VNAAFEMVPQLRQPAFLSFFNQTFVKGLHSEIGVQRVLLERHKHSVLVKSRAGDELVRNLEVLSQEVVLQDVRILDYVLD
jgi:hypothetical protein